ncbi:transglutaminase-like domain-containing protein [Methanocorpusculum sp. GPch4]|uniref:transglutaminase-like domain-containing protein n=1 Tax=Methanocorpusculum sp. GPch4 TaxID=2527877 RepID=UPI001432ADCA|nr:transglutaminase-like domain-containing protein [Methanocorpusculum sp. GPch4]
MKLLNNLLDKDLYEVKEEDLLSTVKKQRNTYFICTIILILLLVLLLVFFYVQAADYNEQIDNHFSTQYQEVYYPKGEENINLIINETRNITDPIDKLTAIADWEIDGFINFLQYQKWNTSYNHTRRLGSNYVYDDEGRIRAASGPYQNDPYWIAYHKIGACGELGTLFAYVANQSGFETRLVSATYADLPNNHAWVEVKVNDEWMYFDPTVYWDNYNNKWNQTFTDKWYGSLDEQDVWGVKVWGIYDKETRQDVCNGRYENVDQIQWWEKHTYRIRTFIAFWIVNPILNFFE